MLRLEGIKKDYKVAGGYVHALKGIDLDFRKNEFVCILGQSGCGKTTLLNVIGGLDHYTEGDLVIQGKSTRDFKDRDWDVYRNHRIGFIFQTYNLIPHQTVLGNVELALTIAGLPREERRARAKEALARVGLGAELNKRPNQLSGGQMQRVAIARALVNNPDILLADEPTGALDSKTSVEVMDLIKEISGERLVIMVTHNPELAEKYATRIVKLHDGLVEADSDPYDGTDEAELWNADRESDNVRSAKKEGKKLRARMGFLTSLALSARNLLTKKGRTILTAFGGSIGIISVCLVLALSSGFNRYIEKTEEDMLSYYPIQVTENSFDMTAVMGSMQEMNELPDMSKLDDKVYINAFLTGLAKEMAVVNNISERYTDYLKKNLSDDLIYALSYGYGVSVVDNLYTSVDVGGISDPSDLHAENFSLSALKQFYMGQLIEYSSKDTENSGYAALLPFADFFGSITHRMPDTQDISSEGYGDFVLTQYDIVGEGHFPQNENEIVLVLGANGALTDMTAAQLGLINERQFISPFLEKNGTMEEGEWDNTVDISSVVGKEYVLYYNDAIYVPNPDYNPLTGTGYPFNYKDGGRPATLEVSEESGMKLTISAVLKLKNGYTYGCLSEGLNLTEQTLMKYIRKNMESQIVKWIKGSYVDAYGGVYVGVPVSNPNLSSYYTQMQGGSIMISSTDSPLRYVGGSDEPSAIAIYPKDFDSKEKVLSVLDEWNKRCGTTEEERKALWDEETQAEWEGLGEGNKITYTDTVGLLMGMVQTILDVITYVLVAFTAISLVVSSVMIGIITYVSVVERVKEIGVLRSLGARKQDIRNLFNAETFIIGLGAGLIGAAVTYILEIPINTIIYSLSGIAGIASLPILTAAIMVLISVALTLISGLIPASAAAKKDPVIALRTE